MLAMAANEGEKSALCLPLTRLRPMANGTRNNQERPLSPADSGHHPNARLGIETLNSHQRNEVVAQAISKANATAAHTRFPIHRGGMGASQVGACAIEATTSTEGLRPLT